jgi:hypothetical protein
MTGNTEARRHGEDLLVGFGLAVIAWIEDPSDDLRRDALIYRSRLVGPPTGVPHVFEDFAHRLEQHRHSGSETR